MTATPTLKAEPEAPAELVGFDAVELYVGNAKQASFYYRQAFGFQLVGYAGPETGAKDRVSYALQQNDIRLPRVDAGGELLDRLRLVAARGVFADHLEWANGAGRLHGFKSRKSV